ncbi:hypothetical protein AVEN_190548-1 [Araneus ventricosus]|uniref:CCHC-type domain-containing protein n=1 Tax=Araneus ventricosus TaxID=182803 RepID=A0A4Y2CE64_ARAVE|nr:hypothetical protein AVEN_190548-1 [Araneus ventricosus]
MIENPSTFSEAVEFATRVEKSQELLTPKVNVVEGYAQNNDFEKILKTTTETYAKSLELETQQLQALTSRLDYLQNGTEQQRNFIPQVIICSYCSRPGHIAPNCYQKSRDRQGQTNQNMRRDFNFRRQNQYYNGRQNQSVRQNQSNGRRDNNGSQTNQNVRQNSNPNDRRVGTQQNESSHSLN